MRQLDPAMDAALLLRRIGMLTLGAALPIAAVASRRAAVVLVPIGVVLLVLAALVAEPERFLRAFRRRAFRAITLALLLLAGWTVLSMAWGAASPQGPARALNLLLAIVLGVAGVAALPERARPAHLNIAAFGIGASALLAMVSQLSGLTLSDESDGLTPLLRGLTLALILGGPSVAWLLARGRTLSAAVLLLCLLTATALSDDRTMLSAGAVSALAFALVLRFGTPAILGLAGLAVALILLGPALPFALLPLADTLGLDQPPLRAWIAATEAHPAKLITGYGLETIGRDKASGALSYAAPGTILFEIWRELGLVGAVALAVAIWLGMNSLKVLSPVIQAGVAAAYATAFMFGLAGIASFRAWWLMTLVAVVVIATAIARGQPRTDRPMARYVESTRRRRPAPAHERPVVPLREAQAATGEDPASAPGSSERPSSTA